MNREDNVYFTLAQQFKGLKSDTVTGIYIGIVTSVSPLLIQYEGIQLDRQDLLINSDILKDTKRKVKVNADEVAGSVKSKYNGTLESFNMEKGTITNIENKFEIGSKVVLLSQDNQKFILLCEVR